MIHIGNTPLLKLEKLVNKDCAEIYVKYEGANPTGSMKDRMALSMIESANELSCRPNSFRPDQFNNTDNRNAYHKMAEEIISQVGKDIDEFIMGVGTGGCFSGNAEVLKNEIPSIRCIAIEPDRVRSLSGGDTSGTHRLEGIGAGFIPSICRLDLADEIMQTKDDDAIETARKLARFCPEQNNIPSVFKVLKVYML